MREVSFTRNYLKHPAGSCLAAFGDTQVICTASVEDGVPPFLRDTGRGWLTAEYAMLPGSTPGGRKRRELLKRDGRSTEIQRLIGRSLRAAVRLDQLGPFTIYVDCDVLQADGGTRTAAISGAWVAVWDALAELDERRRTESAQGTDGGDEKAPKHAHASPGGENSVTRPKNYLNGQVAAVSVGIVDGAVVCDLDYAHDSRAEVDMNIVKLDERLVEVQGTGEQGTFSRAQLLELLDAADAGIGEIQTEQRRALGLSGRS